MFHNTLSPLKDYNIISFKQEIFSVDNQFLELYFDSSVRIKVLTTSESLGKLIFSDKHLMVEYGFSGKEFPYIFITSDKICIPSLALCYSFDSSSSFNSRNIYYYSSFALALSSFPVNTASNKYVDALKSSVSESLISSFSPCIDPDLHLFAIDATLSPFVFQQSKSNRSGSSSSSMHSTDGSQIDDDDLLDSESLSQFFEHNQILTLNSVLIPDSARDKPRLSILLYTYKSSLLFILFSLRSIVFFPNKLFPFLRAISQYLYGRNRFPFLTFYFPFFTSSASIYALYLSNSAPLILYGALSYLLVARMLKISYIATKVLRRCHSDIYPVLFISQILPLYILIFSLNLFTNLELLLLILLFHVYCQLYQYALKYSHFIGDVRMFYKFAPSVVFAVLSFANSIDSPFFLPLSFLFVILIMLLMPKIFRLQV